jgi:hypothetical protein
MVHSHEDAGQRGATPRRIRMRQTARIESLSYSTIYVLGCCVAGFMSYSQGTPLERLAMHVLCSWGYVVYWVLNYR